MAYTSLPHADWASGESSTAEQASGLLARFTSALFGAAPEDKPSEPVRPIQVRRQAASTTASSQPATTTPVKGASSNASQPSHRGSPTRPASTFSGAPGPRPRLLSVAAAPSVHLSDAGSGRAEMTAALPASARGEPSAVGSPALAESIGSHLGHSLPPHTIQGFPILSRDTLNDDARSVSSFGGGSDRPDLATLFRRARHEGLSKDFWMADASAKVCFDCNQSFMIYRRKHHCRLCGQIFCSRCAANIINADKFGQSGVIRVCNLCMAYSDRSHPDPPSFDDFGSPSSVTAAHMPPSRPAAPSALPRTISAPLESMVRAPQAQFAASTLFTRADFASPSYDALEQVAADRSGESTRPGTAQGFHGEDALSYNLQRGRRSALSGMALEASPDSEASPSLDGSLEVDPPAAPFRRALAEDDADTPAMALEGDAALSSSQEISTVEPSPDGSTDRIGLGLVAVGDGEREVSASPADSPIRSLALGRSRHQSKVGELDGPDVTHLTRLLSTRTRRDSLIGPAPVMETLPALSTPARTHVERLLRQCLVRAQVPDVEAWQTMLSDMLFRLAQSPPVANVRAGDPMDVGHFVRIKRVPGGRPRDSELVNGVVCTKNILHKAMRRSIDHPRIMLLSFALEYQRVENQLMSLDALIKQERDYLRNLVGRIAAQQPHVVLVERNVSRLAIDFLHAHKITVARNVKPRVIQAIARSAGADIISSIDRLATQPILGGRCGTFRTQTFVHNLIPGRRKTLMRFEDCPREAVVTIVLRGGTMDTLSRIKRVVGFMVSVVCSARLETFLLYNEQATVPMFPRAHAQADEESAELLRRARESGEGEAGQVTRSLASALEPYLGTILSSSSTVHFPPPRPLVGMRDDHIRLLALRQAQEDDDAGRILAEESMLRRGKEASDMSVSSSMTAESNASTIKMAPAAIPGPASTMARSMSAQSIRSLLSLTSNTADEVKERSIVVPDLPPSRASELADLEHRHADRLKAYENYRGRHVDSLEPADHQYLIVLHATVCSATLRICAGPELASMQYYGLGDETLGQYLERAVSSSGRPCGAKGCDRPNLLHYRVYVHGRFRVQVVIEQYPCPVEGAEDRIIMWSYCKLCKAAMPYAFMAEPTWHYSFGKWLELGFYHDDLACRAEASLCPHNVHRDHVRYFALRNLAVRVHIDPIELFEAALPSLQIRNRLDVQRNLRTAEYTTIGTRAGSYFDSVAQRIRSVSLEAMVPEVRDAARNALADILRRAETDRKTIVRQLDDAFGNLPATSAGLGLNAVLRTLQDKVVEWDAEFTTFEARFMPPDRGERRYTQLRRLFSDSSSPASPEQRAAALAGLVPPVLELDERSAVDELSTARVTLQTSASDPVSLAELLNAPIAAAMPMPTPLTRESLDRIDAQLEPLVEQAKAADASITPAAPPPSSAETSPVASVKEAISAPTSGAPSISGDREQDDDSDSDTTVCADPPRVVGSMPSGSEADAAPSVRTTMTRKPRIDALVKRFDAAPAHDQPSVSPTRTRSTPLRPPIPRRGRSDLARSQTKTRPTQDVFSDGEVTTNRRVGAGGTMPLPPPPRIGQRGGSLIVPSKPAAPSASTSRSRIAAAGSPEKSSHRPAMLSRNPSTTSSSKSNTVGRRTGGESSSSGPHTRSRATSGATPSATTAGVAVKPTPAGPRKSAHATTTAGARVSTLARHYDKLSREAERDRQRRLALSRGRRARPVAVSKPTLDVYDTTRDALKEDSDEEGESNAGGSADDEFDDEVEDAQPPPPPTTTAKAPSSVKPSLLEGRGPPPVSSRRSAIVVEEPTINELIDAERAATIANATALVPVAPPSGGEASASSSVAPSPRLGVAAGVFDSLPGISRVPTLSEGEMSSSGTERSSILKTISSLWQYRGCDYLPLEYPLLASEHIFANQTVIVREDEPSSLIAFALSSKAYREKLREGDVGARMDRTETFMPDQPTQHGGDRVSGWGLVDYQPDGATDGEDLMRTKVPVKHFRLQFDEGSSRFFVKVFFADQFDALRRNCGIEHSFIESLARCRKWDASGGKSGSAFLKTHDDRYIVKEISRLEMDAFLRFAPAYFDYMARAFFQDMPTLLAKNLGFFRLGIKNPTTGKAQRLDLLVMENLMYQRSPDRIYDLKGSTRNRHNVPTGKAGEVLLDGNLVEVMYKTPLYVTEQAKKTLRLAIHNDSLFLANLQVMDYSLVCAIDSARGELVVGIIDFIRTFTLDKRFESWVKSTGKGEPTIISPTSYRDRFIAALESYFVVCPDSWTRA